MMVESILQQKWLFLILGEVFFSLFITCFLLIRYWFQLNRLSFVFIILLLLSDGWLVLLGILDYAHTKSTSLFQIVTILLILYAFTIGKKDMKKLDEQIKRKVAKWKDPPTDEDRNEQNKESGSNA
ncbi:hypothetical protein [Priestia abyssalis]|uniref:hypothetical protein n=1 Tax=Priestia abyssalis TaxID=1221450 RepID=UPI00111678FB|nr:hypothetical protein [Priestia abyssalis]